MSSPMEIVTEASVTSVVFTSLYWSLPFVGLLFSLAVIPMVSGALWHRHYGKISLFWTLLALGPMGLFHGPGTTGYALISTTLHHFIPFILMISTLYVLTSHMRLEFDWPASPLSNTLFLALASLSANLIGTTGASLLFIHPFLTMNAHRKHKTHSVIFFIFLVGNIGGCLSPLGDPPLFIGFLNGISFFWPTIHLFKPFCFAWIALLSMYYALDTLQYYRRTPDTPSTAQLTHLAQRKIRLKGKEQLVCLALAICAILVSGVWKPNTSFNLGNILIKPQDLARDTLLLLSIVLSFKLRPIDHRRTNTFSGAPLVELATLFLGIFITAIPVMAILQSGVAGPLKNLIQLLSADGRPVNQLYFWTAGSLSAFLDNAPTYLAFFHISGSNPQVLMTEMNQTLQAISCGTVFMGALTYIGNAPNFMVRAIAHERGFSMPHFGGYMLWSGTILLPLLLCISFIFFS